MNDVYILKEEWIYGSYDGIEDAILGVYSTPEIADKALTRLQKSSYFKKKVKSNDFYNAYIIRETLDPVNDIWLTFE